MRKSCTSANFALSACQKMVNGRLMVMVGCALDSASQSQDSQGGLRRGRRDDEFTCDMGGNRQIGCNVW